jgi:hypothetical protein
LQHNQAVLVQSPQEVQEAWDQHCHCCLATLWPMVAEVEMLANLVRLARLLMHLVVQVAAPVWPSRVLPTLLQAAPWEMSEEQWSS